MLLERRTVSRKTLGDGRLEVTAGTARRLTDPVTLRMDGESFTATLGTLPCTCRGAAGPHVHHFLQADRLRGLVPGSSIDLSLDESGVILEPSRD